MMHFIITRNSYPADYAHTSTRRDITRNITIPSLRKQTRREFIWVLAGGNGLSSRDTAGIESLILDTPSTVNFDHTTYAVQQAISEIIAKVPAGEKIVTTRLDNDDVLLPNFVEDVQREAANTDQAIIDLAGRRIDLRSETAYEDTAYEKIPSPFLSLVEIKRHRRCRIASAYYDQHSLMHHHFPLTKLDIFGWTQLIHKTNKVMARTPEEISARGRRLNVDYKEALRLFLHDEVPSDWL